MEPQVAETVMENSVIYRPIVMEEGLFAKPLYVAKDEEDAKLFLDMHMMTLRDEYSLITRVNSLTIEARDNKHGAVRIGVRMIPSAI